MWIELETALEDKGASCICHRSVQPSLSGVACGLHWAVSFVLYHKAGLDLAGPGGYHVSVHSANLRTGESSVRDVAGGVLVKAGGIGCGSCFHGLCCCSKNCKLDYQSTPLGSVALSICSALLPWVCQLVHKVQNAG